MSSTNLDQFHRITAEQLKSLFDKDNSLQIEVTCPSVNYAQEPLDLANDYVRALFIGNQLARYSKSITYEEIEKQNTFPNWFVKFTLIPSDVGELYLELVKLSKYVDDNLEPDDPLEFGDLLADFEDTMKEKDENSVLFPDLLEAYHRYVAMHVEDDESDWE